MDTNCPKTIYIMLSQRCNENCVFCVTYIKGRSRLGSMTTKDAKKTIKDFMGSGGEIIAFTGGEPTLHDDLPKIIEYAESFNTLRSISIITNGVRLADKKYFGKLIKADKKNKVSFSVSLHSHKKETSELLTASKGTFEKTISGIKNIIGAKKNISIYQVITSKNYRDLPEFCYFLNQKYPQIKYVVFAYPLPYGRALLNDQIYVKINSLKPYLIKALKFLEDKNYIVQMATCGQLPLCVLPGFEEKVLDPRFFSQENVIGTIGKKYFQDFEYTKNEWIDRYKYKNKECRECIFNKICQGLLKKYVDLFGFDGIRPVTEDNFTGNKIIHSLKNQNDAGEIIDKLIKDKLNLIKLINYSNKYLKELVNFTKQKNIYPIIIFKNKVLYP